MSIFAMTWAYKQELACAHKFVLVTLADAANAFNECWPSQASLAKRCGLSRKHVIKVLADLERDGFIAKLARKRANGATTSCQYRICAPADVDWAAEPLSPQVTPPVTRGDTPLLPRVTPPVTTGYPHYVEPLLEPRKKDSVAGATGDKSPSDDPVKEIFDRGLKILGMAQRALLGKFRKRHGDVVVLEAIVACEAEHPSDPVPFFVRCCETHAGKPTRPSPGTTLYQGAMNAALKWEQRERDRRARGEPAEPLLDRRRSAADA